MFLSISSYILVITVDAEKNIFTLHLYRTDVGTCTKWTEFRLG